MNIVTRSRSNEIENSQPRAANVKNHVDSQVQGRRGRGLRDITNTNVTQEGKDTAKATRKVTRRMASLKVEPVVKTEPVDSVLGDQEDAMQTSPVKAREVKQERFIKEEVLPITDIDKDDLNDADAEAEYIVDIHHNLREREARWTVAPSYMSNQPHISERMREILIDWLVEVHLKFKCVTETLFLTVNLLDRYLETNVTEKNSLQLVGTTAFLLASKYEEMYPPEIADLVFITDRTYSREQILAMEQTMLRALQFNLTVPSIEVFRVRTVKAALAGSPVLPDRNAQRQLNYLSAYYTQLTLPKSQFLRFLPSTMGAAAVLLARQALDMTPVWHPTLVHYSQYYDSDLASCVSELAAAAAAAPSNRDQRAVLKKFSHSRYLSVATLPAPALL